MFCGYIKNEEAVVIVKALVIIRVVIAKVQ